MPSRCVSLPIEDCMLDQKCQWFKRSERSKEHCGEIKAWSKKLVSQRKSAGLAAFNKELKDFKAKTGMSHREAQKALSAMKKSQKGGSSGMSYEDIIKNEGGVEEFYFKTIEELNKKYGDALFPLSWIKYVENDRDYKDTTNVNIDDVLAVLSDGRDKTTMIARKHNISPDGLDQYEALRDVISKEQTGGYGLSPINDLLEDIEAAYMDGKFKKTQSLISDLVNEFDQSEFDMVAPDFFNLDIPQSDKQLYNIIMDAYDGKPMDFVNA